MGKLKKMNRDTTTKSGLAYKKIREAIVLGKLQPGEKLVERKIIETFQIGKTPLREAIRQLQSEGIVEASPNKGAIVKKISVTEMEEAYDVASQLEAYAVELATSIMKDRDVKKLESMHKIMIQAAEDNQYEIYSEKNRLFHATFHRLSGNSILCDQIEMVRHRFYRFRGIIFSVPGFLAKSLNCHSEIMGAVSKKEAKKAGEAMRKHLLIVKRDLAGFLKINPWI